MFDETRGSVWQQIAARAGGYPDRIGLRSVARRISNRETLQHERTDAMRLLGRVAAEYGLTDLEAIAQASVDALDAAG